MEETIIAMADILLLGSVAFLVGTTSGLHLVFKAADRWVPGLDLSLIHIFIKRNGEFTVNIALIDHGKPILGVVYAPVMNVMYSAAEGLSLIHISPLHRHR